MRLSRVDGNVNLFCAISSSAILISANKKCPKQKEPEPEPEQKNEGLRAK